MWIESKLKRVGGTRITLKGTAYHFHPRTENGPHIDEVHDEDHIAKLLSVSEAYKFHSAETVVRGVAGAAGDTHTPAVAPKVETTPPEPVKETVVRKTAAEKAAEVEKPDTSMPAEPINAPADKLTAAEKTAKEKAEEEAELDARREADKAENARYAAAVKASGMTNAQADLVKAVLSAPEAADIEAVNAAFVATHDREPNPQAKRETIIKFIRTVATEKGLVVAE